MGKVITENEFALFRNARTCSDNSLANFHWFVRFELGFYEDQPERQQETLRDPFIQSILKEVARRERLNLHVEDRPKLPYDHECVVLQFPKEVKHG